MKQQIQKRARFWFTLCTFLLLFATTAKIGVSQGASAEFLPLPIHVPVPETVFHTDNFAKSMAIDGDTLVVGAPWTTVNGNEQQGVAYIYTRNGGDPTSFTLLKSITGSGGTEFDQFGWSVDIHGDTLVVGGAKSPDGAAYVFEHNQGGANNWGEVRKLVRGDTRTFTHFGRTVAIHGDLIAVSAPLGLGEVHIFQRNQEGANQWGRTQVLDSGLPKDAPIKVASFGETLAFDGETLVISSPRLGLAAADVPSGTPPLPQNFVGSVFVYSHQQNGQFAREAKLFSSDIVPTANPIWDDAYGVSLAISGDMIFVGATAGQSNSVTAGKVFVYQRGAGTLPTLGQPGVWGEVAQLSPSDGVGGSPGVEGDEFGIALYAVDDGIFVSSINQGVGKVYFYQDEATLLTSNANAPQAILAWSERYSFSATSSGSTKFGIPIVGSGESILIGDQAADGERGAIYAYPKAALFAADPNATSTPAPSATPTATPLPGEPCLPEPQAGSYRLHLPVIAGAVTSLQAISTESQPATIDADAQNSPFAGYLAPGCVVTGPGGVKFGATQAAITETIALTIETSVAPPVALPAGVIAHGDYLRISSMKNELVAVDKPFVIAIPVPAGADTAHLALGVLTIAYEEGGNGTPYWDFLDGLYDADKNLFLTTLTSVRAEGQSLVLAQHPDFDSPLNGNEVQAAGTRVGIFTVDCVFFLNPNDCTAATEEMVAENLNDIYQRLTSDSMGFTKFPRLRSPLGHIFVGHTTSLRSVQGFTARIQPAGLTLTECHGAEGSYNIDLARLTLCYDPVEGITPFRVYVMIHEYFHATQYGYAIVEQDYDAGIKKDWIIEGMATAAEESYFADDQMSRSFMSRLNFLQKVDNPLDIGVVGDDATDEYYAQDFWVYVGRRFGVGLGYLATILEDGGATNAGVFATLENEFGVPFPDIYWGFVKNQAIEFQYDLGEDPGALCQLTEEALKNGTPVEFPAIEQVYPFNTQSAFDRLPPLTAKVIEIDFDEKASAMVHVSYEGCVSLLDPAAREACISTAQETLKTKIYVEKEESCFLENLPGVDGEGIRRLDNLSPDKRYFVVVANVQPDGDQGYYIAIE